MARVETDVFYKKDLFSDNLDKTIHNAALKYIHNVAKMQPANDNPKASDEEYNNSQ